MSAKSFSVMKVSLLALFSATGPVRGPFLGQVCLAVTYQWLFKREDATAEPYFAPYLHSSTTLVSLVAAKMFGVNQDSTAGALFRRIQSRISEEHGDHFRLVLSPTAPPRC